MTRQLAYTIFHAAKEAFKPTRPNAILPGGLAIIPYRFALSRLMGVKQIGNGTKSPDLLGITFAKGSDKVTALREAIHHLCVDYDTDLYCGGGAIQISFHAFGNGASFGREAILAQNYNQASNPLEYFPTK